MLFKTLRYDCSLGHVTIINVPRDAYIYNGIFIGILRDFLPKKTIFGIGSILPFKNHRDPNSVCYGIETLVFRNHTLAIELINCNDFIPHITDYNNQLHTGMSIELELAEKEYERDNDLENIRFGRLYEKLIK